MVLIGGSMAGGIVFGAAGQPAIGASIGFGGVFLAGLLTLLLGAPLLMAVWFAPALVYFNGLQPVAALKASFDACLKNWLVMTIFGLITLVLCFFAALPMGARLPGIAAGTLRRTLRVLSRHLPRLIRMQAKKLTAGDGWRWLGDGFTLFRKNPPMLTLVIMAYWLTLAMTNIIPLLGPVIATLAIPAFSVSLMNAVRKLDNGQPLELPILFSGFRKELKTLIVLGGLYLATSLTALGASALADGGLFLQTMIGGYKPSPEELASGEFLAAAQIALILMAPVIMAWWYAPVLVAWHGFSAGKALFFSPLRLPAQLARLLRLHRLCAVFRRHPARHPAGRAGGHRSRRRLGGVDAVHAAADVRTGTDAGREFYVSYRDVFTDSELAVVTDEAGDTFPAAAEDHA